MSAYGTPTLRIVCLAAMEIKQLLLLFIVLLIACSLAFWSTKELVKPTTIHGGGCKLQDKLPSFNEFLVYSLAFIITRHMHRTSCNRYFCDIENFLAELTNADDTCLSVLISEG